MPWRWPFARASAPVPGHSFLSAERPWLAPFLLREKPESGEYGYVGAEGLEPTTLEGLGAAVRTGERIALVWTPDASRFIPLEEVVELGPTIVERRLRDTRRSAIRSVALVAIALAVLRFWPLESGTRSLVVLGLALCAAWAAASIYEFWSIRRRSSATLLREAAEETRYAFWLGLQNSSVTTWLVAALIGTFVVQQIVGLERSVAEAGLIKPAVSHGEGWRLLTAALLHAHWGHLWMNFTAFQALGRRVEVHAGAWLLPALFLLSAAGGNVASWLLLPNAPSVGASGGILGLAGFLVVYGRRRRSSLPAGFVRGMAMSIALTAVLGIVGFRLIDNAAHGGGLLGGALIGHLVIRRDGGAPPMPGRPAQWLGPVGLVLVLGVAAYAVWRMLGLAR